MKAFIFIILICITFISCAKQISEKSETNQNQLIFGKWESPEATKTVLTFGDENKVKAETFLINGKSSINNYEYKIVGENKFYIYYSDSYVTSNTRVKRIEGEISGKNLSMKCVYEKINKFDKTSYPVMVDEAGLCAYHQFQQTYE